MVGRSVALDVEKLLRKTAKLIVRCRGHMVTPAYEDENRWLVGVLHWMWKNFEESSKANSHGQRTHGPFMINRILMIALWAIFVV